MPSVFAPVRFGILTDLHWIVERPARAAWHNPYDFAGTAERIEACAQQFEGADVAAVLVLGDVSHLGDQPSLQAAIAELAGAIDAPLRFVAGNHDCTTDPGLLTAVLEAQPPRANVCALASPAGEAIDGVCVAGLHVGATDGWFGARLGQLPSHELCAEQPLVLASHYPLLSSASRIAAEGFPYPGDALGRAEAATVLKQRRAATVVLSGHVHARITQSEGSILQLVQGAMVEPPFECGIVELSRRRDGGLYLSRRSLPLAASDGVRLPVFADPEEGWTYEGGRWSPRESDEASESSNPEGEPCSAAATGS